MSWFTDNGLIDPSATPPPAGQGGTINPPGTTGPTSKTLSGGGPTAQDIVAAYQQSLGRVPSQQEIATWIGNQSFAQALASSPEAQAYASAKAQGPAALAAYQQQNGITPPGTGWAASPPPGSTSPTSTAPAVTNPNDPAQVGAWLQWRSTQPGADPILQTQQGRDYYQQQILANGGLTDTGYWTNKSTLASAGGAVGAGQNGTGLTGSLAQATYPGGQFSTPPANLASLPSWAQPYGQTYETKPYGQTYTLPTEAQLQQTPGYQFAFDQGLQGIDRGAAAKGTLQTGGTLKAEQTFGTGLADQTYQNAVGNSLNAFNTNYGVFSGDQARSLGAYQTNAGTYFANQGLASSAYQQQYNNASNTYGTNYNVWRNTGNDLFNRYNTLAQYGLSQ